MSDGSSTIAGEVPSAPPRPPADYQLRPATADDIQRSKTMLAQAFFDDPIFGWLIPEDGKRLAGLRHYFGIELRHYVLPHGRVWTTTDLAGAALTLPPGAWRAPLRATMLEGRAFGIHLSRAARMGAAMEWHHTRKPREPHYYVRDIGVHPDMQGKGLGNALMRPTLERCDREGVSAYIEASSERSAALYERLGFRHTKELHVGSCPPLWLMFRPAVAIRAMS
ncbi:MAG TPA: GNAT family N-acetyltransferase [Solirubrobacteraceae bacterium]|jgi:ribosomal protein S18 acetylase RimI-like enzyme|nr:GNAT family N-acetyltransferase [Solirubrobacteraceae bacterium]